MQNRIVRVGLVLVLAVAFQTWSGASNPILAGPKAPPGAKPRNAHLPGAKTVSKNLEIQADDNLVVRRMVPPDQYDEKGNVRKPTKAELKELKGPDPKLVGYKADGNDLKKGQIVTVTLLKKKDDPKAADKNKDADKKDADKKEANKKTADKDGWVNAGTLTGTLTKYQDSLKTLSLRVSVSDLGGKRYETGKDNKIALDDYRVSMVVIQKDQPQSNPSK